MKQKKCEATKFRQTECSYLFLMAKINLWADGKIGVTTFLAVFDEIKILSFAAGKKMS